MVSLVTHTEPMYIARYKPAAQLAQYIYEYIIVSLPGNLAIEKCFPDGFVKLFIYTGNNQPQYRDTSGNLMDWGDGFCGHPVDEDFYVQAAQPIDAVICSFRPQGAYRLYNTPIQHFNNNMLPADVLMGREATLLKEQLQSAHNDRGKIQAMNNYFSKLAVKKTYSQSSAVAYAQDMILASNGIINIEQLAAGISLTRRSLERHFMTQVGTTPKYFARILRFNYAIGQRQLDPACDWQEIIYNCNYFDQSHFIKEFKHFMGTTPEVFYTQDHSLKEVCAGRMRQD